MRTISRKICGLLSAKLYLCSKAKIGGTSVKHSNKFDVLRSVCTIFATKAIPMYIHEHKEWPTFSWDKDLVGA